MGLYDRPYMQKDYNPPTGGGITFGMPKPSRAVKYLLIINLVVFVVQIFLDRPRVGWPAGIISGLFGVTVGDFWQVWQYVTCQFLHADPWHILLNMIGLYFLGSPLEKRWGSKRFLWFYLSCGVVAGTAYVVIGALGGVPPHRPIIGASGGVYGLVLAAAILFPNFRILLLFFPVPIRLAAILLFGGMILMVMQAAAAGHVETAMSDVAHLGGAVAAAVWIWGVPRVSVKRRRQGGPSRPGTWQKKVQKRREIQRKVDGILDKIHNEGMDSLTRKEKKILRQASRMDEQDQRVP